MARFPVLRRQRGIPGTTGQVLIPAGLGRQQGGGLAALGSGLARGAALIADPLERRARRQQAAEDAALVTEVTGDAALRFRRRALELEREATGSASGFSDRVSAELEAMQTETLTRIPLDRIEARELAMERLATISDKLVNDALTFEEANLRGERLASLERGLGDLERSAFEHPLSLSAIESQALDDIAAAEQLYLTPAAARALRTELRGRLAEAAIRGRIAIDPEGTLEALQPGSGDIQVARLDVGRQAVLTKSATVAVKDLERARRQGQAELEAQLAADQARAAADLEVAVSRGEVGYAALDEARETGTLSDAKWASLTKAVDKRAEDALAEQQEIALVGAAIRGEVHLDPKSAEHRQAVDRAFNDWLLPSLSELEPEQQRAEVVGFVERVGQVPNALRGQLRGQLRAGTSEQKAQAADLIAAIHERQPSALLDFDREDLAVAELAQDLRRSGVAADSAIERASDLVYNADEPAREVRRQRLSKEQVREPFEDRFVSERADGPFFEDISVRDALVGDYRRRFAEAYELGGDAEVADRLARRELDRVWGVTRVGAGGPRTMKYAPEALAGVPGLSPEANADWMNEQLLTELRAGGVFDPSKGALRERLQVVADAITARETARETALERPPSYAVLLLDEDGVAEALTDPQSGRPLRWIPDYGASPEAAREADKAATARREAIERARQRRSGQQTPQVLN